MTLLSFITFIPTVILGTLIVHLIWPEKSLTAILLKFSLGTGLGLGISSILYFLVLQIAPGRVNMLILQAILLIPLFIASYSKAKFPRIADLQIPAMSWLQWGLFTIFIASLVISGLVFVNYITSRPQGVFDAWSIWNRAARFIHRDPENWIATLSPELPLLRHADYPLLIPLNVAWGWDLLGNETLRISMMQSILFTFGTIFLMFSALASTQTLGQASLASVILMGISGIVASGTNLVADVPVTYFVLASGILMYMFTQRNEFPLLILSGFMAGLAGWTKNEGLLFIAVSPFALIAAAPSKIRQSFLYYMAGLIIPLLVILYFKTLAPANDLMTNSGASLIEKITDLTRYELIIRSFATDVFRRETIFLFIYMLIMWNGFAWKRWHGILALAMLLVLQVLGYAGIYLITPYDLEWHLVTSQYRLFMQIIPLALFLCFSISTDPESVIFARKQVDS
ncbi:MAG: glycosyltransferase family 39 protein [Anaerolineales bacterium]|nr:glycosyltransferase family 39 protein [Anaerolineales bacterium]